MNALFLTYLGENTHWVRALGLALIEKNCDVLFDPCHIGDHCWMHHTLEPLDRRGRVGILILGPKKNRFIQVMEYYAELVDKARMQGTHLIPITIETMPLPPHLQRYVVVDFQNSIGNDFEVKLTALMLAIDCKPGVRRLVGQVTSVPSKPADLSSLADPVTRSDFEDAVSSIGCLIFVLGLGYTLFEGSKQGLAGVLFGVGLWVASVRLFEGRMHKLQSVRDREIARIVAAVLRGESVSRFFLFCRPFKMSGRVPSPRPYLDDNAYAARGDFEAKLGNAIAPVVLVGFGQPGENLGSGRLPVEDEKWEDTFKHLAQAANGLVVVPSLTPGIRTEIKHIVDARKLPKTIFYMPRSSGGWLFLGGSKSAITYNGAWEEIRHSLLALNLNLPPYDPKGCLFKLGTHGRCTAHISVLSGQSLLIFGDQGIVTAADLDILCNESVANMLDRLSRAGREPRQFEGVNKIAELLGASVRIQDALQDAERTQTEIKEED